MFKQAQFSWLAEKRKNVYSQFGEDGLIQSIFERIGTSNKWCCECGAADGIFFSNTRKLIEEGWSSVQIEGDDDQFRKLSKLYEVPKDGQRVCLLNWHVRADDQTLDRALHIAGYRADGSVDLVPMDIDLLVIDVDGQDYWLVNSLVKYRPRVLMVEYDPAAEKDFIPPIMNQEIAGDYYLSPHQAGLNATINLLIGKYYWPVVITQTNIIAVQQELCGKLAEGVDDSWQINDIDKCQSWNYDDPFNPSSKARQCEKPIAGKSDGGYAYCAEHLATAPKPRLGKESSSAGATITVEDFNKAKNAIRVKERPKLAAIMSTPRLGFLATMDCIFAGLMPLGVPLLRGEGAFWGQTLERAIEKAIASGTEYILTFDYDVVFEAAHGKNDIAKLVCLMDDNPDVDCIVAAQMKREKGPLLATSDKEIRLLDALVPITQGHFGLTIFKASAFAHIPKPWLRDWPNEQGEWGENRIDADIFFWKQAVAAGLNIQMSLDVMVGHLELVVTWPGQNLQTVQQSLSEWREHGRPAEAFERQRVIDAVKANPALLYGPKLDMGD